MAQARSEIHESLFRGSPRFLLIIGPCSIHDPMAGLDYARRLATLAEQVSDRILVVMRAYFEKPRTTVGWKGLILDPHLDGSHDIGTGLRWARAFLQEVLDLGLPTATELLDPITHQYLEDLLCWSAIGARTVESQIHRQMASGLSMPVGFKNGTDGNVATAIDAMRAAAQSHTFMGANPVGISSVISTQGNLQGHLVLRGGHGGPNYSSAHLAHAESLLICSGLAASILVDCSHGNSAKHPERQPDVMEEILAQIIEGRSSIKGAMIESNLLAGNQSFPQPRERLRYGVSITDACIGWEATEALVRRLHSALPRRISSSPLARPKATTSVSSDPLSLKSGNTAKAV